MTNTARIMTGNFITTGTTPKQLCDGRALLFKSSKFIQMSNRNSKVEGKQSSPAIAKLPVSRRSFMWWTTDDLIDCLPQNRPLYKDGGLWQVRTDDMEDVFMHQNCNETLRGFIIRYLEWLDEFGQADEVYIDLALRPMNGG